MAYIVTRNKKSGYVALVEKRRVPVAGNKTSVRNVGYVCGLGVMTQSEFEEFRDWAHGITHQESRKAAVLACSRVVKKTEQTTARVAGAYQKKTTVRRASRQKKVVSDTEKQKIRVAREKEWFETLTSEQKTRYEEKQAKKLRETRTETKESIQSVSKGIQFTGHKTLGEKKQILNERITELKYRIANDKSSIRGWQKGKASGLKIAEAKEQIVDYERILKVLKKQRSELRI